MGNTHDVSSGRVSSTQIFFKSMTPLYEACRRGDERQVQKLLPKYSHADLNRQEHTDNGNTCLHIAAANGHDNIVKLLLERGCYRTALLNSENQSAYELAASTKESTRLLFLRQAENDSTVGSTSRFYEQDASVCFDIVRVESNNEDDHMKTPTIQTYRTEEEKRHAIGYSASSKAMCQSRFARFCVNTLHFDEPLNRHTIRHRLNNLLEQLQTKDSDDYIKIKDLMKQYENDPNSIEQLLHLYTLETEFYRTLKHDCLPLAIPLFMHLPKLKDRYFKGRAYRGLHMTHEQLSMYQLAKDTPGTVLQTRSFSSTSIDRNVAEAFAHLRTEGKEKKDLCILFIFDFPDECDQAINLSRISSDTPCLSEYEDEKEVLILPWTLFEVSNIVKTIYKNDFCIVQLTNINIPTKHLISSFKWSCIDFKNHLIKDKKMVFDCAFQKYKSE